MFAGPENAPIARAYWRSIWFEKPSLCRRTINERAPSIVSSRSLDAHLYAVAAKTECSANSELCVDALAQDITSAGAHLFFRWPSSKQPKDPLNKPKSVLSTRRRLPSTTTTLIELDSNLEAPDARYRRPQYRAVVSASERETEGGHSLLDGSRKGYSKEYHLSRLVSLLAGRLAILNQTPA